VTGIITKYYYLPNAVKDVSVGENPGIGIWLDEAFQARLATLADEGVRQPDALLRFVANQGDERVGILDLSSQTGIRPLLAKRYLKTNLLYA